MEKEVLGKIDPSLLFRINNSTLFVACSSFERSQSSATQYLYQFDSDALLVASNMELLVCKWFELI